MLQVRNAISKLEQSIQDHNEYRDAFNTTVDWLKDKRNIIQLAVSSHGTKDQVLDKLNKLSTVKSDLLSGDGLVAKVRKLSVPVVESLGNEGVDKIKQDIQQLENELKEIRSAVEDSEDSLTRCVSAWDNFTTVLDALKSWEETVVTKVKLIHPLFRCTRTFIVKRG